MAYSKGSSRYTQLHTLLLPCERFRSSAWGLDTCFLRMLPRK